MTHATDNFLSSLSVAEKAKLCSGKDFWHLHGIERLGLPSIMVTDGPHGLRKQLGESDHVGLLESAPATCFPTASGLAATWNVQLIEQVGVALAKECLAEQVSVLLGPGANIKRHPLGGRNFEYFSEDPHLTGAMASAWIRGLQSLKVGASLKHYALNNHERGRMVVDVVVDERTLREIYLPGWEAPVRDAQPWTVMCAYNKFRGSYLSEHEYLLKAVLRDEWGFRGAVVTDWGASHNRVEGVRNGQSLEMPGSGGLNTNKILAALNQGTLSEVQLDDSVRPVVELMAKSADALDPAAQVDLAANHDLARTVAEEACVLLRNEGRLLPLSTAQRILVVGALAQRTRYQGSGSSQITPTTLEQPLDEIRALAGEETAFAAGYRLSGESDADLCAEAAALAADAERIIVVLGLTPEHESEGFDRTHMRLPANQLELLEALSPFHGRTVVVLQNGAPVELPFKGSVAAILEAYLGGQAGASAAARILFGLVNPSGKLAETLPLACADVPSDAWFRGTPRQAQYREGIWVGYRYFDAAQVPVAYPFGHGLSYTRFELTDLSLRPDWGSGKVDVTLNVRNAGERAGAETVQFYVGQGNASVPRPARELKAFRKVNLQPGESCEVQVTLDRRAFAFWCVRENDWVVESDGFRIDVGVSVADIRLSEVVRLQTGRPVAERDDGLAAYFKPAPAQFDDAAFARLLGHPIPEPLAETPYQLNSTLSEARATWLGRMIHSLISRRIGQMIGGDSQDRRHVAMLEAIVNEMPIRSLVMMSQGKVKEGVVRRLIHALNGNWGQVLLGGPVRSE